MSAVRMTWRSLQIQIREAICHFKRRRLTGLADGRSLGAD
jgi:hypothetical protein